MRILLLLTFLCLSFTSINGQQLYIEAGKTNSSFDYENSQGETLENLQSSNHTYLSLGYRTKFFAKGLFVNFNANYKEYGALGSDVNFDNYFEWNLSYLGPNLGFDYEIFKPGNFTVFIKVSAGAEFLIQGTQILNNQVFNLSDEEDFDSGLYVLSGGLGLQYRASSSISVFTQYMYGYNGSFKDEQGALKIKTHNLGIGLLIDIGKDLESTSNSENAQIEELKKELESNTLKIEALEKENSEKIAELESEVIKQKKEIKGKKEDLAGIISSIENALHPYQGNELTIEEREGKVHIIMERELLFRSGSWRLDEEALKTINDLGDFLAKNPNLSVIIEGHADDASFIREGVINNNWDLSAKRASTIVQILEKNKNINPKNLIVAGRAQYDPIGDNTTTEGKAKNRRITFIIVPKLDELLKMTKN